MSKVDMVLIEDRKFKYTYTGFHGSNGSNIIKRYLCKSVRSVSSVYH